MESKESEVEEVKVLVDNMLNNEWRPLLAPLILQQPLVAQYLGPKRSPIILPTHDRTFAALNALPASTAKLVIFARFPFPTKEQANGIACCDASVKNWTDEWAPGFSQILKNLLLGRGMVAKEATQNDVRKIVIEQSVVDPPEWFDLTIAQGVLWLNAALTYVGLEPEKIAANLKFWAPIFLEIIKVLIQKNSGRGLIFIHFGEYAKTIIPLVRQASESLKTPIPIRIITAKHPLDDGFHDECYFVEIDKSLAALGYEAIEWLPKKKSDKRANL